MQKPNPADDEKIRCVRERTATIFKLQGRHPRILITRIPPNGSEQSVKSVATAFADIGFDVDINLSDLPPAAMARIAIENDAHVIGITCVSSASAPFMTQLLSSLDADGGQSIQMVGWLSVQACDFNSSLDLRKGNFRIFGAETDCSHVADHILKALECAYDKAKSSASC
jgi:methylmalonyl-CoA mutase